MEGNMITTAGTGTGAHSVTMVTGPTDTPDLQVLTHRVKLLEHSLRDNVSSFTVSESALHSRIRELEVSEQSLLQKVEDLTSNSVLHCPSMLQRQRLDERLHTLREEVRSMSQEKERGDCVWRERLRRCQAQLRAKEEEMGRQSQYFEHFKSQLHHKLGLARDREQGLQTRLYQLERPVLEMNVSAATYIAPVNTASTNSVTADNVKSIMVPTSGQQRTETERLPHPREEGEGEEEDGEEKTQRRHYGQQLQQKQGADDRDIEGEREGEEGEDGESLGGEARLRSFILSLQEDLRVLLEREEQGLAEQRGLMEQLEEVQENNHFLSCTLEEMRTVVHRLKLTESSLMEEVEELQEENQRLCQRLSHTLRQTNHSLGSTDPSPVSTPSLATSLPNTPGLGQAVPCSVNNTDPVKMIPGQSSLDTYPSAQHHGATERSQENSTLPLPQPDLLNLSGHRSQNPGLISLGTKSVEGLGELTLRGWCPGPGGFPSLNLEEGTSEETEALKEAYRSMGGDMDSLRDHRDQLESTLQHTQDQLHRVTEENARLKCKLRAQGETGACEVEQGSSLIGESMTNVQENKVSTQNLIPQSFRELTATPYQNDTILALAQDDLSMYALAQDDLALALNQENRALGRRIQELLAHIESQEGESERELVQLRLQVSLLERESTRLEQENLEQGGLITELTRKTENDLNTIIELQERRVESGQLGLQQGDSGLTTESESECGQQGEHAFGSLHAQQRQPTVGVVTSLQGDQKPGSVNSGVPQVDHTVESVCGQQEDRLTTESTCRLREKRDELIGYLSDLKEERDQVALSLSSQTEEKHQLTRSMWVLKEERDQIHKSLCALKEEKEQLTRSLCGLKDERDKVTRSMCGLKEERDQPVQSMSGLQEERDQLVQSMSGLQKERDQPVQSMSGLQEERDQLVQSMSGLQEERDQLVQSMSGLQEERDQLVQSMSGLQEERDQLVQSMSGLQEERDQLVQSMSGLQEERDQLLQSMSGLQEERDQLLQSMSGLQKERDQPVQSMSGLQKERDQPVQSMSGLQEERDQLVQSMSGLQEERDQLSQSLFGQKDERDQLMQSMCGLKGQRDQLTQTLSRLEQERDKLSSLSLQTRERYQVDQFVSDLKEEKEQLVQSMDVLREQREQLTEERDQLQMDVATLRNQLLLQGRSHNQQPSENHVGKATRTEVVATERGGQMPKIHDDGDVTHRCLATVYSYKTIRLAQSAQDHLGEKEGTDLEQSELMREIESLGLELRSSREVLKKSQSEAQRWYRELGVSEVRREEAEKRAGKAANEVKGMREETKEVEKTKRENHTLRAESVALKELSSEYTSLKGEQGSREDWSNTLTLLRVRYDDLRNKYNVLLRKSQTDLDIAPLKAKLSCLVVKCQQRNSLLVQLMRALRRYGCLDYNLTQEAEDLLNDTALQDYASTFTPPSTTALQENTLLPPAASERPECSQTSAAASAAQELSKAVSEGSMREHFRVCVATADYCPSPNMPHTLLPMLPLSAGESVQVTGLPDRHGMYHAEVKGESGLVPARFLEENGRPLILTSPSPERCASRTRKLTSPGKIINLHQQLQNTLSNSYQTSPQVYSSPPPGQGYSPGYPNPAAPNRPKHTLVATTPIITSTSLLSATAPTKTTSDGATSSKQTPNRAHPTTSPPVYTTTTTTALSSGKEPLSKTGSAAATSNVTTPVNTPPTTVARTVKAQTTTALWNTAPTKSAPPPITAGTTAPTKMAPITTALPLAELSRLPDEDHCIKKPLSNLQPEQAKPPKPRAIPEPPAEVSSVEVIRTVGQSSLMIGWERPPLNELGCSNGTFVYGYMIYVEGEFHKSVMSSACTKCILENLDLSGPVHISVQTLGSNGLYAEKVHLIYRGKHAQFRTDHIRVNTASAAPCTDPAYRDCRTPPTHRHNGSTQPLVAIYNYNPLKDSPNLHPSRELALREGDTVMLLGNPRNDGFCQAEVNGRRGLAPVALLEEVPVPDRHQCRQTADSRVPPGGEEGEVYEERSNCGGPTGTLSPHQTHSDVSQGGYGDWVSGAPVPTLQAELAAHTPQSSSHNVLPPAACLGHPAGWKLFFGQKLLINMVPCRASKANWFSDVVFSQAIISFHVNLCVCVRACVRACVRYHMCFENVNKLFCRDGLLLYFCVCLQ
ncbi:centromere-associated protein E-like isoform X3 [Oncorhynchus masou masou]|uniref:centromere-associated protein E-like isoform X3 n=1 Tax=Oncorhynchus masou masou TaxID=90313 RepID=UPI0031844AC5